MNTKAVTAKVFTLWALNDEVQGPGPIIVPGSTIPPMGKRRGIKTYQVKDFALIFTICCPKSRNGIMKKGNRIMIKETI